MTETMKPKDQLIIAETEYDHVKDRLAGGRIYRAHDGDSYLRIGEKQLTAEEHIHLVALANRGYPVARVSDSGTHGDDYYFIEESLGEQPFAIQFGKEYQESGVISDQTFERYLDVMRQYTDASFDPKNHRHAKTDIRQISLLKFTRYQYGLDEAKLDKIFTKAQERVGVLPTVEIHEDLGPFNVMDRGVIDFESVQDKDGTQETSRFGPIGFDVIAGPITGYYFPKVEGYHHKLLYEFSENQLAALRSVVSEAAKSHNVPDPNEFTQEFLLMRTIWAAARNLGYEQKTYSDPEEERFWSEFRANILNHVVHAYDKGEIIDPRKFPDIGIVQK